MATKFPQKVIIHQRLVEGTNVRCDNCIGLAKRAITSDTIESWEVEFSDNTGKKQVFSFDKHNLEIVA